MPLEGLYAQLGNAPAQLAQDLQRNKLVNANILSQQGADQRAQQQFQMEQEAARAQAAQRQQYNALMGQFFGPDQAALISQTMGQGAPQPQGQPDRNALLSQLYQMDPERTTQLVRFQQDQQAQQQAAQQREAQGYVLRARHVLASDKPGQALMIREPEFARQMAEHMGINWEDGYSDEEARAIGQAVIQYYGPTAGVGPYSTQEDKRPATIQTYEYAERLSPKERERFLETVRAPQVREIAGVQTVIGPGGVTIPLSSLDEEMRARLGLGAAGSAGTGQGTRASDAINAGLAAADALAITRRGLDLLREVKTGGLHNVALKASNLFGVTGADEAELSANLGKAVLAQLRSTFGAQFTEREGARLGEIEAGFGKSTEGNKRLLEQAEKLLERTARRGLSAAAVTGDKFSMDEIKAAMGFTLSSDGKSGEPRAPQPVAPNTSGRVRKYNPATGNLE